MSAQSDEIDAPEPNDCDCPVRRWYGMGAAHRDDCPLLNSPEQETQ